MKEGAETSVIFALTEGVGALAEALKVFKVRKIFEKEKLQIKHENSFSYGKKMHFLRMIFPASYTESSNKLGFNSIPIFQKI